MHNPPISSRSGKTFIFLDCEVRRSRIPPPPRVLESTNQCSDLLVQYLTVSKLYYSANLLQASNSIGKGFNRIVLGGRDGFDGCWCPDTAFPGSPEQHPGSALPWAQQQWLPGISGEPPMVTVQEMGTVTPPPEGWNSTRVPLQQELCYSNLG